VHINLIFSDNIHFCLSYIRDRISTPYVVGFFLCRLIWGLVLHLVWYWWNCLNFLFIIVHIADYFGRFQILVSTNILAVISNTLKVQSSKWKGAMVFNVTFNNISAISCQSLLLVEETGVLWENYQPEASHWQTV